MRTSVKACLGGLAALGAAFAVAAGSAGASSPATGPAAGLAYITGDISTVAWLANATGGDRRKLGPAEAVLLAPSGRLAAVVADRSSGRALMIYNASGTLVASFYNAANTEVQLFGWSTDSRYLAVGLTGNSGLPGGVGIVDLDSFTTRTVGNGYPSDASFAPTGSDRIVFSTGPMQGPVGKSNLYTADAASGGATQLTHTNRAFDPLWSKLGIVFDTERLRGKQDYPVYQLELLHGGRLTQITHTKPGPLTSGLVPLAVSADGRDLIASFTGEDTYYAETVNLATHATHELKIGQLYITAGGISRNGRRVLVDAGGFEQSPSHGTVETLPFAGGRPTVLVKHAGDPVWNQ
jgi:hypothetical protein